MAKRSCRRTAQEDIYHDRAVKLRKMTDEQLCTYIDDEIAAAYKRGMEENVQPGKEDKKPEIPKRKDVSDFISEITNAKVPGIGAVTINKLLMVAKENGYIKES